MSTFGDYKAYKKYEPAYKDWKHKRDIQDAKRIEYLKQHPEINHTEDVQRARALLRAIDVMDEYSQKRAEDMEVATETVVGYGLEFALLGGMLLGALLGKFEPIKKIIIKLVRPLEKLIKKYSKENNENQLDFVTTFSSWMIGGLLGGLCAFPLMAWAAKTEVAAARKGRFEAMDKDLESPNGFAVLTPEQMQKAEQRAKNIKLEKEESKIVSGLKDSWKAVKDMVSDSSKYKAQRLAFLKELEERKLHLNDAMSPKEIENAKRDQQLLTKIVEKIDIASQDYAENAELATQTAIVSTSAIGFTVDFFLRKLLAKHKSANKILALYRVTVAAIVLGIAIAAAQIQKQASRVGRFKVKQELLKNPEQLIYVNDENTNEIGDVKIKIKKKDNILKFLKQAWKNNKEYKNYKKTTGKEEKKIFKAIEELELNPEQIKDAKILQKNTFRTFNKIDENSQKYAESIEALGQAIIYPISTIFTGITCLIAPLLFIKNESKSKIEMINGGAKMAGIIFLSTIPTILINAFITKEQKKASRIADMIAINELSDYREFRA